MDLIAAAPLSRAGESNGSSGELRITGDKVPNLQEWTGRREEAMICSDGGGAMRRSRGVVEL